MIKKLIYIVILYFAALSSSNAQWALVHSEADSLIRIGSKHIYNVEFDSASSCFGQVIKMFPEHPAGYFMDAMTEWWKIRLFRETEEFDDRFLEKIDKVIDICDRRLDSNQVDIVALFFAGGAYGYRGRYNAMRRNFWDVANDGRKGYDILTECWKLAPGNHDIQLGTGLYNYFVIEFSERYPVIKPLLTFFPRGDKNLGILQLKSVVNYARYTNIEAKDVLLEIYYNFEKQYDKALEIAIDLNNSYPNNPYFHRYLARSYTSSSYKYKETADIIWREILKRCIRKELGYDRLTSREALYYIGRRLFSKRDYKMSMKYFLKCDEACRAVDKDGPSGFMVLANLYMAKIYDIQKKRKYAVKQYEKVLRMKEYYGSHKSAERYLKKPYGS